MWEREKKKDELSILTSFHSSVLVRTLLESEMIDELMVLSD